MQEYDFTISPFNSDQFTALIQSSSIVTALDHIGTAGSAVAIFFKAALSDADVATLDALVSNYVYVAPTPSVVTNPDGVPIFEQALPRGEPGFINFTIVSPDFSDRTTWYQKSVQVTGETLTNPSSDGVTYTSANANWININSPKLTYDYKKILERDGSLSAASMRYVAITANGVAMVEGTDFSVNYPTGIVTFISGAPAAPVVANYWHNNNVTLCSEFLFTPPANYQYRIEHVEAQFSKNAIFNSPIQLEIWAGSTSNGGVNLAGYGGFANAYYDAGYGQSRSIYRNCADLMNWCTNSYPIIPACGNLTVDILCFPFLYIIHPVISANQGTLIRLFVQQDNPVTAEICTVTLYMEKGPTSDP